MPRFKGSDLTSEPLHDIFIEMLVDLLIDHNISPSSVRVWLLIAYHPSHSIPIWEIAHLIGASKTTVKRAINELEYNGWLRVTRANGQPSKYLPVQP